MAARLLMDETAREHLRRLSVVFSVELRLKIVVELYMREMSPKQFFTEFGGGSVNRVYKNFLVLEAEGWLRRLYTEGPGGARRGGIEQFYRATEPPIVDSPAWALLPYSVRLTSSWNLLRQIAPRLRRDLEAPERGHRRRDLTRQTFLLDEEGRNRAMAELRAFFLRGFEEQEDARRRALRTGEELFRVDIFLIGFQAFYAGANPALDDLLVERKREPPVAFSERLAPIMGDDASREIMSTLNREETSVTKFHREFGLGSRQVIRRRFQGLTATGWSTPGAMRTGGPRRGAVEKFYRPTIPPFRDYVPYADPPKRLIRSDSWRTFEQLCEELIEAIASGAFDARTDRCLTWSLLRLDNQGWERVVADLDALLAFIEKEQADAGQRMKRSHEEAIPLTVALAAFEALEETDRAP